MVVEPGAELRFEIKFPTPVDGFSAHFPWASENLGDHAVLIAIDAQTITGEQIAAADIGAYFSKMYASPFRYVQVEHGGLQMPRVDLKTEKAAKIILRAIPWNSGMDGETWESLGAAVVTGTTGPDGGVWTVIKVGEVQ